MKRILLVLALVISGAIVATPASAAEFAVNGGFESGSLSPWSCTGGTGSVVSSPVRSGTKALQGAASASDNAKCSQTVTGLVSGTAYTLTGWFRGNYTYLGVEGGASTWQPSSTSFVQLTVNFTASGSSATIYTHGWYGQGTYHADDISLQGAGGSGVPGAPGAPSVTSTTNSSISLSWGASSGTVTGYRVYEGTTQRAQVTGTSTMISGLGACTAHTYTIRAYNSNGESPASAPVTGTTLGCVGVPGTPGAPSVTGTTNTSISLSWGASSGTVTGYRVYEGSTQRAQVTGTTATISGLAVCSAHTYTIKAYNSSGESANSSPVSATTTGCTTVPGAPSNLSVTGTTNTSISLSWTASTGTVTGYRVYEGTTQRAQVTGTSATISGLGTCTNHTYTVKAYNANGESPASNSASGSTTGCTGGGNKLLGYFVQWGVYQRGYHVKNIHTSGSAAKLTHINYAFGNVQGGACTIGDMYADYDRFYSAAESVDGVADTWDAGALRGSFNQLRKLKQMYPHIKVLWSFGGWTWSGGFGQAAANPTAFANSCYNLVEDPRWADVFDGIDLDWEYPNACGLTCDTSGYNSISTMMQAVRNRFGSGNLVTAAVTADGNSGGKVDAANYLGASQYLDWYNVMTYDFFGAFAAQGPTAPHSALSCYAGMPTAGFCTETAIAKYKAIGVPASKLLVGIGFYGRGWTGVTQTAPGGSATGAAPGTYEAGIEDYKVLKNTCPPTATFAGTSYSKCGSNWWSYDTPSTIGGKMNYAKAQGLGGAFFWELTGDTTNGELITAMKNGLN
ncbi:glycosyl hydrolase family 18 protein [Catelliglobosispora koreensis]|uniref:glycosyl hydrolase family 18 protein n=1 Tax=Catelliglobosispora koreensis TaxID=129052 RepID=UPI00037CF734|nr:glycosyl hydrolase family 18 protein [Catelliglobosispora koreensis]